MATNKQSLAGDFKKIAATLREEAVTVKNSHYNSKWGWSEGRKEEYDELRRLASVAESMSILATEEEMNHAK